MKKCTSFLFAFGLGLLLTQSLAFANLLDDPGFEAATPGGQTSNSNWSLNVNFPDTEPPSPTEGSAQFQEAAWASNPNGTSGKGVWFKAFKGDPDPGIGADADLSQSVVATVSGDYSLSFYARKETNFTASVWDATVSSDGTGGSASLDLLTAAPADGSWNQYFLSLTGVTAGDTLSVSVVMDNGVDAMANPQSAFVDDFDLHAIPEPASFALLGLGSLGMLLRRRR